MTENQIIIKTVNKQNLTEQQIKNKFHQKIEQLIINKQYNYHDIKSFINFTEYNNVKIKYLVNQYEFKKLKTLQQNLKIIKLNISNSRILQNRQRLYSQTFINQYIEIVIKVKNYITPKQQINLFIMIQRKSILTSIAILQLFQQFCLVSYFLQFFNSFSVQLIILTLIFAYKRNLQLKQLQAQYYWCYLCYYFAVMMQLWSIYFQGDAVVLVYRRQQIKGGNNTLRGQNKIILRRQSYII